MIKVFVLILTKTNKFNIKTHHNQSTTTPRKTNNFTHKTKQRKLRKQHQQRNKHQRNIFLDKDLSKSNQLILTNKNFYSNT